MRNGILTLCIVALVTGLFTIPTPSKAAPSIPEEPTDEGLIEQSSDTVVGLLFRSYSLRGDGQVDYRTARHILGISYDDPACEEPEVAPYPVPVLVRSESEWSMGDLGRS